MIEFDPLLGSVDVLMFTPTQDVLGISQTSAASGDAQQALQQVDAQSGAQYSLQQEYRASAENMNDSGLVASSWF